MFWLSLKASLHIFHFENKKNTTKDGRDPEQLHISRGFIYLTIFFPETII